MQGEGVIATREFTLFVPGTPTKGKILEYFRKQVPDWVNYRFDAKIYMDQAKYWTAAEQDLVPGWSITVFAERVDCKVTKADDGADMRDGGVAAQIGRKKRVE